MYRELMIATGRQWALSSMVMYRFTGLLVDHTTRFTYLQLNASMAYLQLGTLHMEGIRHVHDQASLSTYLQQHHWVLGDHPEPATAAITISQQEMAESVSTASGDNVICFATALQERSRNTTS